MCLEDTGKYADVNLLCYMNRSLIKKNRIDQVTVFINYLSLVVVHVFAFVQRITVQQIRDDEWFKKGYVPVRLLEYEDVNLDDVNAFFDDTEVGKAFICHICFISSNAIDNIYRLSLLVIN